MATERFMRHHYGASGYVEKGEPSKTCSPESPFYCKVEEEHGATPTFMIVCDEGWRENIVCNNMYGWAADWLIEQLQGKPYAPERRPA
jgi:hypothetical protein